MDAHIIYLLQEGNGLYSFAQSHFISQDAVLPVNSPGVRGRKTVKKLPS
jgi:hypothetical protein